MPTIPYCCYIKEREVERGGSCQAQANLIRNVYRRAGLDPTNKTDRCQFFEAHGTGNPAGDPAEDSVIVSPFILTMVHADSALGR